MKALLNQEKYAKVIESLVAGARPLAAPYSSCVWTFPEYVETGSEGSRRWENVWREGKGK